MIEVKHLTKKFGHKTAVDNISFRLEPGQTMALVGTSGCGKTTTLKMINRLIEPTEGEVYVDDTNVLQQSPEDVRRKMGYVIQNIGLFPHYTIEENIAVVPKLLGWNKVETSKRVFDLMERLKLAPKEYARKYPEQLSGGQQQRVGIARALAGDPPIVLMDEPFGALDPITKNDIKKDFKELDELANKTTIIVTHDIQEAFELGDFICVLNEGKVQQTGTSKDLLFHPANEFVRQFLSGKTTELKLNVITLKDLFDQLPAKKPTHQDKIIHMEQDHNLMEAIAQLTKADLEDHVASVQIKDETRYFTLPTLMNSFNQIPQSPNQKITHP